jgi:PadR family transcriptional regulator PadR
MPRDLIDAVQGTLEFLILKRLSWGEMNGYGVARWIRESSRGELIAEEGTVYPALHRLEDRGLVEADWGITDNNRRAKFYRLTRDGRKHLAERTASWEQYTKTIARMLRTEPVDPWPERAS